MGCLRGMDARVGGVLAGALRLNVESINKATRLCTGSLLQIMTLLLLWGCASAETPTLVQEEDVMIFLEPGLRPETLLFPEYLLMENFELETHGRIPQTPLVGVGLRTGMGLKTVLRQYNNILSTHGWQVTKAKVAKQSFRLMAVKKAETLEIRAVQGTGPTQVFVLYKPGAEASAAQ